MTEFVLPLPATPSVAVAGTGTPAGVGAVGPGQTITGGVDGIGTIEVTIGQPV